MSYLSRLKQLAGDEKFTDSPEPGLTKPPKAPFVSSVGTVQGPSVKFGSCISADVDNDPAKPTPADARMKKVLGKLHGDPGLRYAVEAHDDIELEAVILTLAIRGKAACELRIPKSRYDGFALMELIETHTTRETLQ